MPSSPFGLARSFATLLCFLMFDRDVHPDQRQTSGHREGPDRLPVFFPVLEWLSGGAGELPGCPEGFIQNGAAQLRWWNCVRPGTALGMKDSMKRKVKPKYDTNLPRRQIIDLWLVNYWERPQKIHTNWKTHAFFYSALCVWSRRTLTVSLMKSHDGWIFNLGGSTVSEITHKYQVYQYCRLAPGFRKYYTRIYNIRTSVIHNLGV